MRAIHNSRIRHVKMTFSERGAVQQLLLKGATPGAETTGRVSSCLKHRHLNHCLSCHVRERDARFLCDKLMLALSSSEGGITSADKTACHLHGYSFPLLLQKTFPGRCSSLFVGVLGLVLSKQSPAHMCCDRL